jgi:hypothetical protein
MAMPEITILISSAIITVFIQGLDVVVLLDQLNGHEIPVPLLSIIANYNKGVG